jgi:CheY-like chemotaxis protein
MGEMLRRCGLDVDVVADGDEAVEAVRSLPYHVVLMDIEMPGLDGMEATRQIRQLPGKEGQIPIVALTANVLADSRERFLEAGMNDYVSKPVTRETLMDTVVRWANVEAQTADTTQASGDQSKLIDEKALQTLGEDTSPDLVPRMIEVFVDELRMRASSIQAGIDGSDVARLAKEAHALKSSAATYGAIVVAETARRVDQACKDGDRTQAMTQAQALLDSVEPTVSALSSHPLARA